MNAESAVLPTDVTEKPSVAEPLKHHHHPTTLPVFWRRPVRLKDLSETLLKFSQRGTSPVQTAGSKEGSVSERKSVQRLYQPRLAEDKLRDFGRKKP